MLHDELARKWSLDDGVDAPVFVGEFGDGAEFADDQWWGNMLRFLQQYDLDFAYWPINGDVWKNETQVWENEGYGILNKSYSAVRRPAQLAWMQQIVLPYLA